MRGHAGHALRGARAGDAFAAPVTGVPLAGLARRVAAGLCWALALGVGTPALAADTALRLTDDLGRSVVLPKPPQRIVSLLPSLTESVCALGACERLVAVDRYSNWPVSVQTLPQVGGGIDPNLEAIVAMRPDLVLASASSRGLERLQALGVPLMTVEPKGGMADMQRVLRTLGQALNLPPERAHSVWTKAQAEVQAAAAQVPAGAKGMTVFFQASMGPFGAGPQSFMGEVLGVLGLKNVLPESLGPFPKLNPEYVVRANPQWLMSSEYADLPNTGVPTRISFRYPGWNDMPAVREGRVCLFSRAQADVLVRPGPRLGEAARIVVGCLQRRMGVGAHEVVVPVAAPVAAKPNRAASALDAGPAQAPGAARPGGER